jgi:hypothetical protein
MENILTNMWQRLTAIFFALFGTFSYTADFLVNAEMTGKLIIATIAILSGLVYFNILLIKNKNESLQNKINQIQLENDEIECKINKLKYEHECKKKSAEDKREITSAVNAVIKAGVKEMKRKAGEGLDNDCEQKHE